MSGQCTLTSLTGNTEKSLQSIRISTSSLLTPRKPKSRQFPDSKQRLLEGLPKTPFCRCAYIGVPSSSKFVIFLVFQKNRVGLGVL